MERHVAQSERLALEADLRVEEAAYVRCVYSEAAGVHSTSLRRLPLSPNHNAVKAVGVPIASGKMPPGLSLVCGLTVR
jgi:hypothetical protein